MRLYLAIAALFLAGCSPQPPKFTIGQVVNMKGFYKGCRAVVHGFYPHLRKYEVGEMICGDNLYTGVIIVDEADIIPDESVK